MDQSKTIFCITGTTQGLGNEVFSNLLEKSVEVVTINRRYFDHSENIIFDFNNIDKIESDLFSKLDDKFKNYKKIIFILNAAAIDPIKELGNYKHIDVLNIVNTNLISQVLLTNYVVKTEKESIIVNVSTGGTQYNFKGLGLYLSTKLALKKLFEISNIENNNVTFINYDPGTMNTQMVSKMRDTDNQFDVSSRIYLDKKNDENSFKCTKKSAEELINLIL